LPGSKRSPRPINGPEATRPPAGSTDRENLFAVITDQELFHLANLYGTSVFMRNENPVPLMARP
jgi:hypothetical protein